MVQYGTLLFETLAFAFVFLFASSTGVLAIELTDPGAFGGDINNL
jgi:hypothetical protein